MRESSGSMAVFRRLTPKTESHQGGRRCKPSAPLRAAGDENLTHTPHVYTTILLVCACRWRRRATSPTTPNSEEKLSSKDRWKRQMFYILRMTCEGPHTPCHERFDYHLSVKMSLIGLLIDHQFSPEFALRLLEKL